MNPYVCRCGHPVPLAGRSTPLRRTELAGTLEALAAIVRASVPPIAPPAPEPTDRETVS